ncbi:Prophage PSPPH06, lysis protein [Pseudomonas amygdali pv. mori]|uniref:Prophage PSPPH06, lysis protein n=3 Tax=Pseudomonas syringae group genomosp. 2 TaxID=251698 RepID=A0A3M4V504_PSEA0|nr:Prophage PSPPH06, lysis protein [Pseudomonas savastanoi pv. phaseolicola]RMQ39028.1 Prophage PSPPH06, lysis protein [Pseudomonas amygdali pv. mori]RMQ51608.1 Prophage PSPPH06, lysis protein [Pseudomonas savastanoi pv. glycinea]RMR46936.1 Prophage PSPPH06, lysis protein [Pseudomonas amygdali pv. mori]RMV40166.1 Prophage PSPPH06, lysis protein [Pseudomonas savastanoi pv. phaseolicola]
MPAMTISPLQLLFRTLFVGLVIWLAVDWALDRYETVVQERNSAITERDGLREAARIRGEQLAARDQLDTHHTEELNRARAQINTLQLAVADGRYRLRIKAVCPAMPGTAGTTGLADAGSAELAADARSDYFTLRDELALSRQMILGLQDYIRQVVQRTPAQP